MSEWREVINRESKGVRTILWEDGRISCTCETDLGKLTTAICQHAHNLIRDFINTPGRTNFSVNVDEMLNKIAYQKRFAPITREQQYVLSGIRHKRFPEGTFVRVMAYNSISAGDMVRLLPSGEAASVKSAPAFGVAVVDCRAGQMVTARIESPQLAQIDNKVMRAVLNAGSLKMPPGILVASDTTDEVAGVIAPISAVPTEQKQYGFTMRRKLSL